MQLTNHTHPCNNHKIIMVKGKAHKNLGNGSLGNQFFIDIFCKECNKYIKHASDHELRYWDNMTDRERDITTYDQLRKVSHYGNQVYDNNPEEYIKSFPQSTLWLNIPFNEKEEAKQAKAGIKWDPYVKVWHTDIFHKNAMKLKKWMFPADIKRVTDYHTAQPHDKQKILKQHFAKRSS